MWDVAYVVALVVVGTLVVTWTLGRVVKRLREPANLVGYLLARLGASVLLVIAAVAAAEHGSFWLVLVPIFLLPALWSFVHIGLVNWAWTREEGAGSSVT